MGGGEGGGGEGLHVPQVEECAKPAQYALVPTHAQMMKSLFPSDRELAPCRVKRGEVAERATRRAGRGEGVGRGDASSGQGWLQLWRVGHARSAR